MKPKSCKSTNTIHICFTVKHQQKPEIITIAHEQSARKNFEPLILIVTDHRPVHNPTKPAGLFHAHCEWVHIHPINHNPRVESGENTSSITFVLSCGQAITLQQHQILRCPWIAKFKEHSSALLAKKTFYIGEPEVPQKVCLCGKFLNVKKHKSLQSKSRGP